MSLRILRATLKKNLLVQMRAYPMHFFIGNLLTSVYTALNAWLAYRVLFDGQLDDRFYAYAGTGNYMSFVIVGGICYLFVVRTCLNVSRSLMGELWEGTLESLMLAPFRRAEYFVGNMMLQTVTTSMESVIALGIGFLFGLRLGAVHIPSLLAVFLAGLYSFFGISMILGCIMLYTRNTYITQNTLFAFIALVCGITFPSQFLPGWLQVFSALLPVTGITQMLRGVLLTGETLTTLWPTLLWVLLTGSVYIAAGFPLMARSERVALEKMEG